MSRLKFKIIRYSLLAYVMLTLWQVLARREDYPLSSFPMFSQLRPFPGPATRTVLVGVSDRGEVPLESSDVSDLMSPVRLQKICQQVQKKSDAQRAEFMGRIVSVLSRGKDPAEQFWAVRFYTETWRTQLGLRGIDSPTRELDFAFYIPPPRLVELLATEAKTNTPAEPPRSLPNGDWLADLDGAACVEECSVVDDPLAAGGRALRLAEGGSLHLTVPSGGYSLFLRLRTRARAGSDRLTLEVDGKRPKNVKDGLGNYKRQLASDGWVWASLEPGWPALRLKSKPEASSELVLRADRAPIEVDEIWLSREQKELPVWNARLESPKGAGAP
jgi:hypothetical protein